MKSHTKKVFISKEIVNPVLFRMTALMRYTHGMSH